MAFSVQVNNKVQVSVKGGRVLVSHKTLKDFWELHFIGELPHISQKFFQDATSFQRKGKKKPSIIINMLLTC